MLRNMDMSIKLCLALMFLEEIFWTEHCRAQEPYCVLILFMFVGTVPYMSGACVVCFPRLFDNPVARSVLAISFMN